MDILVNNAGITRDTTFKKMTKADWDAVIKTNLDSAFNMTKPVCDGMVERGWGRVINVSSVNGSKGAFGQTNYSAAKAGMHGFTKALALEVARKGVTVNTISPGYIGTKMVTAIPKEVLDSKILPQIPLGRLGKPEEVAGPDHLPLLGRGGVRHRREHRHQRRAAHAVNEMAPLWRGHFRRNGRPAQFLPKPFTICAAASFMVASESSANWRVAWFRLSIIAELAARVDLSAADWKSVPGALLPSVSAPTAMSFVTRPICSSKSFDISRWAWLTMA